MMNTATFLFGKATVLLKEVDHRHNEVSTGLKRLERTQKQHPELLQMQKKIMSTIPGFMAGKRIPDRVMRQLRQQEAMQLGKEAIARTALNVTYDDERNLYAQEKHLRGVDALRKVSQVLLSVKTHMTFLVEYLNKAKRASVASPAFYERVGPISRYLDVLTSVLEKSSRGSYQDLPLDILMTSPYQPQSVMTHTTRAIGALGAMMGRKAEAEQKPSRPTKRRRVSVLQEREAPAPPSTRSRTRQPRGGGGGVQQQKVVQQQQGWW